MTEITESMIERGVKAAWSGCLTKGPFLRIETAEPHETIRQIIAAALTEPTPEPEIPVTEEMVVAAGNAYRNEYHNNYPDKVCTYSGSSMSAAYRAMRKLEPLPTVSDEAVEAYVRAAGEVATTLVGYFNPHPEQRKITRAGLTAAIPFLFKGTRHKARQTFKRANHVFNGAASSTVVIGAAGGGGASSYVEVEDQRSGKERRCGYTDYFSYGKRIGLGEKTRISDRRKSTSTGAGT